MTPPHAAPAAPAAPPAPAGAPKPFISPKVSKILQWSVVIIAIVAVIAVLAVRGCSGKGTGHDNGTGGDSSDYPAYRPNKGVAPDAPAAPPAAKAAPKVDPGRPIEILTADEMARCRPIGRPDSEPMAPGGFGQRMGDRFPLKLGEYSGPGAGWYTEWFYLGPQIAEDGGRLRKLLADGKKADKMGLEIAPSTVGGGRCFRFKHLTGDRAVRLEMTVEKFNQGYRNP